MAELLRKNQGIEELLELVPPEKRLAITAKILTSLYVIRGEKIIAPDMGRAEGFTLPALGVEKWTEINQRIFGDGAKRFFPWVKEMFNIPVKNAIEAAKLETVVGTLFCGPEQENEYPEATPERAVIRITKCAFMERYKEFDADLALSPCVNAGCQGWCEEGLKVINPKLTLNYTKVMPRGDPYCECTIQFKEE
jgi:hypothetical protein